MKFDDILQEIGEFGTYQKQLFYLLCLPIMLGGAHTFSVIFTYDIPSHRCALPGYPHDTYRIQNEAHAELVNTTIPLAGDDDYGDYSNCLLYENVTSASRRDDTADNVTSRRGTHSCSHWVYDTSDYDDTIITEFDLICGEEIMRSHSNMVSFASALIGSLFVGIIADVFGRKKAIFMGCVLLIIYSVMSFVAQSFYVIMASRVLGGVAGQALFAIVVTAALELVGPSKRSFAGVVVELYWSAGVLLLLPVAYLVKGWRWIQLSLGIGTIPVLVLYWLIPESPRWLLEKRRHKEVEITLKKICQSNKTKLPEGAIGDDTTDEGPQSSVREMFMDRILIVRFVIIFFNWFGVSLLYYGISLNTTNLEGSIYINYLFSAVVELAAYCFLLLVLDRVGRRKLHCTCMLIGGLACLGVIAVIETGSNAMYSNILSNVGKFCVSASYAIMYIMSSELLPTSLRTSGLGVCSIFENVGGILSPYIADLGLLVGGPLEGAIPMIVFGGTSLIAGGLALLLPETLHRKLPETMQDAVHFGKKESKEADPYYNLVTEGTLVSPPSPDIELVSMQNHNGEENSKL